MEFQAVAPLTTCLAMSFSGAKRSWFRLGSLKSGGRSSAVKVSESQVRLVADVCVMYQTMLATFSQIRLDILTGIVIYMW